ncbi:hypothetical protein C7M84_017267 [Penaeus vannamei]|uniref:Uncharacterized protein n=1 Tax=Penaeus vannamei TaxID=6689 RepID=A0A3R7QEF7_PENVA|nr:hypothetical protein C7M84_017267 [Penaeus vannamei]
MPTQEPHHQPHFLSCFALSLSSPNLTLPALIPTGPASPNLILFLSLSLSLSLSSIYLLHLSNLLSSASPTSTLRPPHPTGPHHQPHSSHLALSLSLYLIYLSIHLASLSRFPLPHQTNIITNPSFSLSLLSLSLSYHLSIFYLSRHLSLFSPSIYLPPSARHHLDSPPLIPQDLITNLILSLALSLSPSLFYYLISPRVYPCSLVLTNLTLPPPSFPQDLITKPHFSSLLLSRSLSSSLYLSLHLSISFPLPHQPHSPPSSHEDLITKPHSLSPSLCALSLYLFYSLHLSFSFPSASPNLTLPPSSHRDSSSSRTSHSPLSLSSPSISFLYASPTSILSPLIPQTSITNLILSSRYLLSISPSLIYANLSLRLFLPSALTKPHLIPASSHRNLTPSCRASPAGP